MGNDIMNTIDINELPTLTALEETDRIYVFKNRDGRVFMDEIPITELSTMFYSKDFLDRFNEKYNELLKLSADFLNFLNKSFPTEEFLSSNIATVDYFEDVYSELAYKSKLEQNILEDYTTRAINEKLKQKAKKEHEELKKTNLDSSTGTVLFGV